ncbi:bactofilin family protein [Sneathiella chinensis]|uniref:Cell shape determination protein CcmA n=1 Tax=Sneathiella chinensis TaxID=349750 RepID=A0ABQ5U6L2_9PROT|nr:polymer-forming cytoskeletal protein [Sneathiella chinensis]GLQ07559.1 hypothetical protein GCM10007924_27800 [Sneathiella chinensis]
MFSRNSSKKTNGASSATGMPSIIAKGMVVTGDLVSDREIQIEGVVVGNVRAEKLGLGESAHVTGDINAGEIVVRGKVDGNIRGVDVVIAATASVKGNVTNATLQIDPGARIDGHCTHSENPRDLTDPVALFDGAPAETARAD